MSFRSLEGRSVDDVLVALRAGVADACLQPGPWAGNPRDFYARQLVVVGTGLYGRVGLEHGHQPVAEFTDTTSLSLGVDGPPARALVTWDAVGEALAALGYVDETLSGAISGIVHALAEVGDHDRVREVREASTAALIERIRRDPAPFGVALTGCRPHDLDAVLLAVPDTSRVRWMALGDTDLASVPQALFDPPLFPALETIDLSRNPRLRRVPALGVVLPALRRLDLTGTEVSFDYQLGRSGIEVVMG